jgi:uncharacterized protein YjbI with pentapeptide repeats
MSENKSRTETIDERNTENKSRESSRPSTRWRPAPNELEKILDNHRKWLESGGRDGERAEIYNGDLSDADLHLANLRNAVLWETHMYNADLRDADLTEAEGVVLPNLAGANLSGAILPENVVNFSELGTVERLSKISWKLLIFLVIFTLYSWLTLLSVTDGRLLSNSSALALPFSGIIIPTAWFFIGMPVILFCLFIYFQLVLQRNWEALSDLPAIFPDGVRLDKKAYPWLLNGIARAHIKLIRKNRPVLSRLQNFIVILLTWWLLPGTMIWFWLRYLKRHDWTVTGFHIITAALAVGFSVFFYRLARRTLRRMTLSGTGVILRTILFIILIGVLVLFSYSIQESPLLMERNHPLAVIPKTAKIIGYNLHVDLSHTDVSFKPQEWTGADEQLSEVKGANLGNLNLSHINATNAFLVKADLAYANLYATKLDSADLRFANFLAADLEKTGLVGANLQGANLTLTNMIDADIEGADFRRTIGLTPQVLYSAKNWFYAHYDNDILDSLKLAPDHSERVVNRDFSYCQLSGANFRNVSLTGYDLSGADLREADLSGAELREANLFLTDLRGTDGIDPAVLQDCNNWLFALYDDELLAAISLPANHNDRVSAKDFRGYNLAGMKLYDVDLKGANLREVDLSGAVLKNVNLRDADLYNVRLNNADLNGTNFKGTILLDTDLRGADLSGALNLTTDQVRWASIDSTTLLPDYLKGKLKIEGSGN